MRGYLCCQARHVDWIVSGKTRQVARQVGNAVWLLERVVERKILDMLGSGTVQGVNGTFRRQHALLQLDKLFGRRLLGPEKLLCTSKEDLAEFGVGTMVARDVDGRLLPWLEEILLVLSNREPVRLETVKSNRLGLTSASPWP
jgi:hypothetical protein